jgi:hypothetical protein
MASFHRRWLHNFNSQYRGDHNMRPHGVEQIGLDQPQLTWP